MVEVLKERQVVFIICAIIVSSCLLLASTAMAEPFERTASGWLNRTDFDVDANGSPLSIVNLSGKGTFGKSTSNDVSETGPFAFEFCDFFPQDVVVVRIPIIARSTIIRFSNGDLLYASLATDGPPSSLCVDTNSESNTSEVHLVITGGTGKFAGATGTLLVTASSTTVLREAGFPVHVAITRVTEGEIVLVDEDD